MMHHTLSHVCSAQTSGSRVNILSLQAFSRHSEHWITAAVAKNLILPLLCVKLHTALLFSLDILLTAPVSGPDWVQETEMSRADDAGPGNCKTDPELGAVTTGCTVSPAQSFPTLGNTPLP